MGEQEPIQSPARFESWRDSALSPLERLRNPPHPTDLPLPDFFQPIPRLSRRSYLRQWYREMTYRSGRTLARLLLALGVSRSLRLAAFVGRLAYYLTPGVRKTAEKNLQACLGSEISPRERKEITKQVLSNFTVSAVEVIWMSRWSELIEWLDVEIDGAENLEKALSYGRGVIAVNAHFGNWEVMSAATTIMGYPAAIVARQQKDSRLNDWIHTLRQNCGIEVIIRGKNPMRMVRALQEGKALGMMIDLDTRSTEGAFLDFFGRPTYTQVGPFVLARRLGAVILPCLCYREGLNRLRFYYGEPWEVDRTENQTRDILAAAARANVDLEAKIRERPEQWAWFHKRWKTSPDKIKTSRKDFAALEDD